MTILKVLVIYCKQKNGKVKVNTLMSLKNYHVTNNSKFNMLKRGNELANFVCIF